MFRPTSRYAALPVLTAKDRDGRLRLYVARRFIPPGDAHALAVEHLVAAGDRLDLVAARYLDDPEQSWRVCDANDAMSPADLVVPGRRLRIALPFGVPGPRRA
jgi:hypothetical protein